MNRNAFISVPIRCASICVTVFMLTSPGQAETMGQGPCSGVCLSFNAQTGQIPVIRSFEFPVSAPGNVLVEFDGTMQCAVDSKQPNQNVIDLATQIVTAADASPNYQGPGGGRHAMRLTHSGGPFGPSAAVNLSSRRLIQYQNAGAATVYYKIAPLRMDPGTSCAVYSAAFYVITTP